MLPEEITRPPVEHTSTDAAEFSPLSDEFFQRAAPADPLKKKRKPIQLAAGAMAAVAVVNAFAGLPLAQIEAPTESPMVEVTEPPIVEIVPPAAPSAEPPFEMEVLEPHENSGDICIITVYADYYDITEMGNPILMEQTVQESTFTELALPEHPYNEGYSVLGYVIDYSPCGSNFTNVGYNPGSKSFAVDVGLSLTLDEIQLVPVWEEDQIRHVYVHPVWVANEGVTNWKYAPVVTLDSGDKTVSFPIDLPLGSGGSFYVCAIVPEREGYTFAGWYDEQDQLVYTLFAAALFTQKQENGEGVDWTKPTNVTLTAKWIKNQNNM